MRFSWKQVIILAILSFAFLMLGNGVLDLTHPDEVFYTQTAKEMAQNRTWMIPYLFGEPQFEKPPLTYWLLRLAFIIFGVSSFSARFFPALFAIIGVIAVYLLALAGYNNRRKAFFCALVLMSSGLYIGLARTVFTDMFFSIFMLLSLMSFYIGYIREKRKPLGIILFFLFSGLAVLAKGPLGFLMPLAVIILFLAIRKELKFLVCKYFVFGMIIFIAVSAPWYLLMMKKFGSAFIYEFFYNDHWRRIIEAEHKENDTWFFYPLSIFLGMFPWSIFVLASIFNLLRDIKNKISQPINLFLLCQIAAVLAAFIPAHSKLVSYILPLFPAMALIAGDFIDRVITKGAKQFFVISFVSLLIFLSLPFGLVFAVHKYSAYIVSKTPVYNFIYIYAVFLAAALFVILSRKARVIFCLISLQIPLFLCFAVLTKKDFEQYISVKKACDFLIKNYPVQGKIVSSKIAVRGVRFFTDKDVAVVNVMGSGFFSPHPIPYLDADYKVNDFLRQQPLTYGIVNKSSLLDLIRVARDYNFKLEMLKNIGSEYIIRIISGQETSSANFVGGL